MQPPDFRCSLSQCHMQERGNRTPVSSLQCSLRSSGGHCELQRVELDGHDPVRLLRSRSFAICCYTVSEVRNMTI